MKKNILITGASGDIGQQLCRTFIANNYRVIGIYNSNHETIENLSVELGSDFHYFQCDLSDFDNCKSLSTKLKASNLSVDILINNAGISLIGLIQDLDVYDWNNIWNTNVTSAISLSKELIPGFLQKRSGKIINISSVWGEHGASCEVCYSATKGAINSLTKALALELAPSNIQVNAIACGIIDTKMNSHLSIEETDSIIEEIPVGRIGSCSDVADVALYLANATSYLTGQIITVDGGWTL